MRNKPVTCEKCGRVCKSGAGYWSHTRKCPGRIKDLPLFKGKIPWKYGKCECGKEFLRKTAYINHIKACQSVSKYLTINNHQYLIMVLDQPNSLAGKDSMPDIIDEIISSGVELKDISVCTIGKKYTLEAREKYILKE